MSSGGCGVVKGFASEANAAGPEVLELKSPGRLESRSLKLSCELEMEGLRGRQMLAQYRLV